ncbi:dienelactone hydrolase family protein [Dictyobacter aurantiacus]|uniref:DeoR family transcriptional regulator n=1 Tax=Dictyobacter aurantiacus TaxID=1936993 RepID=A0A401ZGT1_9CHLR|nr:alpha/beta fold hydrolase [Dictyobacter aurantiacus]GCE06094.1 DeoR family transcriptional regulator [Dictyobacter aurantiacus]
MGKTQLEKVVQIPADAVQLAGSLALPEHAGGLVVFAHGSGSSRFSPRNTFVARQLNQAGIGTLLMDLLTEDEDRRYETRFDIDLLTDRLLQATYWLQKQTATKDQAIGYFGASTGAAAALKAAAARPSSVRAVVSRGGRPDLADEALAKVQSPTLLIVGGNDPVVLQLNRSAFEQLPGEKELVIVPGATHLFEEPGTLEEVARLATGWFRRHLHSVPVA